MTHKYKKINLGFKDNVANLLKETFLSPIDVSTVKKLFFRISRTAHIKHKTIPLTIFLFFISFYIGVSKYPYNSDTIVTTYLPINIIRGEGFNLKKLYPYLDTVLPTKLDVNNLPYYITQKNNYFFSTFPVFSAILALPIYIFPVIINNITIENLAEHFSKVIYLGTLSASIFSSISVVFVFLSLTRFTNRPKALLLSLIYGLGTSTLSLSSQSLWQHGASQMFLSISLYYFIRGQKEKKLIGVTGLFLELAVLSRFINVIIAAIFAVYLLIFERKQIIKFIIYSMPPVLIFAMIQFASTGNLFFYEYEGLAGNAAFSYPIIKGFFGLLIAPSKGLFVYSPIFLFSIIGTILAISKKDRVLQFISIVSIFFIFTMAKWTGWQGGWFYGPRMLTDITPFLILLIVPVVESKFWTSRIFKFVFFFIAFISISIHLLGAIYSDLGWYRLQTMFLTEQKASSADFLFSLKYPEIYYYYLYSGGFFGVINLFFHTLLNVLLTMIKGTVILAIVYIIFRFLKEIISRTLKLATKL